MPEARSLDSSSNNTPMRMIICLLCLIQARTRQHVRRVLSCTQSSMWIRHLLKDDRLLDLNLRRQNNNLTLSDDRLGCLSVWMSRSYRCSWLSSNSRNTNDATGHMLY
ncbi:hypothetical protein E4T39_02397 [Aureobasidium subglaciale]|nr:hypothetical protein E4T39_02397 [Aureobasidium subglaciale]